MRLQKEEAFLSRLLGVRLMLHRYARDHEEIVKNIMNRRSKPSELHDLRKSGVKKSKPAHGDHGHAAHRSKETLLQIGIKDDDFVSISRQKKLKNSICSTKDIYQTAFALIAEAWEMSKPVRLLNVTAIHLCEENQEQEQMSFFESPLASEETKYEKADAVLDEIRRKYGEESVGLARLLDKNEKKKKDEL